MSERFTKPRLEKWRLTALLMALLNTPFSSGSQSASGSLESAAIWGTYAIQSVLTEKNLRPFQANTSDGAEIVLYTHWRWKCMTWQFVRTEGNSYRLINRYTGKTFEMDPSHPHSIRLQQQMPGHSPFQEWNFYQLHDGSWLIRLQNSELYLTASSTENNSPVLLMPQTGSDRQRWRLLAQDPWL